MVSLALSLSTDSSTSGISSTGAPATAPWKRTRRGESGGDVGGGRVRLQDLRPGLRNVPGAGRAPDQPPPRPPWAGARRRRRQGQQEDEQHHDCHICGLGFETGQALGGHMRRHREDMALGRWVALSDQVAADDRLPVLLELFV
ncbi:hypothetical protein ZWY2020_018706 [Hordeum vulgare]|nr:hypothetical protein ZWY2020_018706 [Hordeum vulgare]